MLDTGKRSNKKYLEEIELGKVFSFGQRTVTEQEIIDFAIQYDPMEFHTCSEKAKNTPIGGLIASGLHSLGIQQKLAYENLYKHWHIVAGKSVNQCEFIRPVYPNDCLSVTIEIIDKPHSLSTHRGDVVMAMALINQAEKPVLTAELTMVVAKQQKKES